MAPGGVTEAETDIHYLSLVSLVTARALPDVCSDFLSDRLADSVFAIVNKTSASGIDGQIASETAFSTRCKAKRVTGAAGFTHGSRCYKF